MFGATKGERSGNFDVQLREEKEGGGNDLVVSSENDVFLLYSQYLTRYDDEDIPGGAVIRSVILNLLMRERGGLVDEYFHLLRFKKERAIIRFI